MIGPTAPLVEDIERAAPTSTAFLSVLREEPRNMDTEQGKKEEDENKGRDLSAKEEVDHRGDQQDLVVEEWQKSMGASPLSTLSSSVKPSLHLQVSPKNRKVRTSLPSGLRPRLSAFQV